MPSTSYHLLRYLYLLIFCPPIGETKQISEMLYVDLFTNYIKELAPMSENISEPVVILLDPALYSLIDVSEAQETVTVSQWFSMTWTDSRLSWDPAQYGDLKELTVHDTNIWMPDVKVYEMLDVSRSGDNTPYYARLKHNGIVSYASGDVITVHCQLDVHKFPYDIQTCPFSYASWAHHSEEMILKSEFGETATQKNYHESAEWTLVNYTAKEVVKRYTKNYYEVHFQLVISRKPGYYILTLSFPSFMIVFIAIIGLFSPNTATQDREEKVTLGLTALLTIAVILMMVADLMPKNSIDFPLMGDFILYEMILISIATITATGILYLNSQAAFGRQVPLWLLRCTGLLRLAIQDAPQKSEADKAFTVASSHLHKDEEVQALHAILILLQDTRRKLEEYDSEAMLYGKWMAVCFRLDLFFLVLYLIVQIIMTMYYFL